MATSEEATSEALQNEQDWTKSCPICFVADVPLARSENCGHAFCVECLEQFFHLPPESTPQETTTTSNRDVPNYYELDVQKLKESSIESIATLGRCPLCRSPMSLLDMKHGMTRQPVWSAGRQGDIQETPLAGNVYATRRGIGYNSFHFPPFPTAQDEGCDQTSLPYLLWQEDDALYPKLNNDTAGEGAAGPSTPTKYFFERGCFYFTLTRTFHGRVYLPDAHGNLQPHNVLLCFANNHKWITGGFMLRHLATAAAESSNNLEASQQYFPLEGKWKVTWYRERLPSDASLEDERHSSLVVDTGHVNVVGNTVQDISPMRYMLRYKRDRIYFHWPGMKITQTLESECDFRTMTSKDGGGNNIPAVGDYLKWTTTDPQQPFIVWQRESIGDSVSAISTSIEYFGRSGGDSGSRFNVYPRFAQMQNDQTWYREWRPSEVVADRLLEANNGSGSDGRPQYHSDQLWGNTFCQGLRVGLASYHFGVRTTTNANGTGERVTEEQPYAYISYENAACLQWPPLDDGSPIPPQVYFHDISIEEVEETRPNPDFADENDNGDDTSSSLITTSHIVFRGNIEWLQDYGTTWQNNERWEYEMHFDSQLTCIVSGTVHCITSSSSSREEMSHYGTELIYLNAGIEQALEEWMDPHTNDDEGNDDEPVAPPEGDEQVLLGIDPERYQRYTQLSRRLRRRLQTEGASVRTVAMVNRVLTMSQQPGSTSPIDYNFS